MAEKRSVAGRADIEINAGCVPDPANPHTWMPLFGEPAGMPGTRVMYGCLRPAFRGASNSAAAFGMAKLMAGAPTDSPPWTITAARAEVLLPAHAVDSMSDPRTLMEMVDAELPAVGKALLAYLTFTFDTLRLHIAWEDVRRFIISTIVKPYAVPVLLIQHAPHRAGSTSTPHIHALVVPRRVTPLGLSEWVTALIGDKAHALIRDAFVEFRASSSTD